MTNKLSKNVNILDVVNATDSIIDRVDSNFLPANTVITVKTDGTGDFTSLQDVFTYLKGKWSNGAVNISIAAGTYTLPSSNYVINCKEFNIPMIVIFGASNTTTVLQSPAALSGFQLEIKNGSCTSFQFYNINFKSLRVNYSPHQYTFYIHQNSTVQFVDCIWDNYSVAIHSEDSANVFLFGTNTFNDFNGNCLHARMNGCITLMGTLNFTNPTSKGTALNVLYGGIINGGANVVTNFTNVATKTSQTVGTATNNGWITGVTV